MKKRYANIVLYFKTLYLIVEIELANIEDGAQAITNSDTMGIEIDCQSDNVETVSDTDDNQIMNSSMENQNEIFSVEDDSPLVEDNISQSKSPNNVLLPENSFCLSWRDKISLRDKISFRNDKKLRCD